MTLGSLIGICFPFSQSRLGLHSFFRLVMRMILALANAAITPGGMALGERRTGRRRKG